MLDPAYVHLLLNHFPIVGTIACILLIIAAFFTRSSHLANAGLIGLVLLALITIPVFLTGEPAEEKVEHLPGVVHDTIEEHEDAGKFALIGMLITGAFALVALFMARRRPASRVWLGITLVVSLWALSVVARTAYLGGKIRHTEMHGAAEATHETDDSGRGRGGT